MPTCWISAEKVLFRVQQKRSTVKPKYKETQTSPVSVPWKGSTEGVTGKVMCPIDTVPLTTGTSEVSKQAFLLEQYITRPAFLLLQLGISYAFMQ